MISPQIGLSQAPDGAAVLQVADASIQLLAIEDRRTSLFLDEEGHWTSTIVFHPVSPDPAGGLRIPRSVVAPILAHTEVALHAPGLGPVAGLIWPGLPPAPSSAPQASYSHGPGMAPPPPPPLTGGARPHRTPETPPQKPEPPTEPKKRRLPWPAIAAAGLVLVAAAAVAGGRNSEFAQGFVCRDGAVFHGVKPMETLVPCPAKGPSVAGVEQGQRPQQPGTAPDPAVKPPAPAPVPAKPAATAPADANTATSIAEPKRPASTPNPPATPPRDPAAEDEKQYTAYLQCSVGKPACGQRDCADVYLAQQPSGAHRTDVAGTRSNMDRQCRQDTAMAAHVEASKQFAACMRDTDVCQRNACGERFRSKLVLEPYASSLEREVQAAAQACQSTRESEAFAAFNQCRASTSPCDIGKCATPFTSAYPKSVHAAAVMQALSEAPRKCAELVKPPTPVTSPAPPVSPSRSPETAAVEFLGRYYFASSDQGERSGARLDDLFASQVNFYGADRSRDNIMVEKRRYHEVWDGRKFDIRDRQVACNGDTCRVTGHVMFDFWSTRRNKSARGLTAFDFTFGNVLTHPQVIAESSKVEQRF